MKTMWEKEKNHINKNDLAKAIVRVVAFFDMFDYPLTRLEIHNFLDIKCELGNIVRTLNSRFDISKEPTIIDKIDEKNGFYFLAGRESILEKRRKRYIYSDRKMKRASFIVRIFRYIPWIRFAAVVNIMGADNLKDESDIDLFIVTEPGRIWISRFFCVGIIKVLGFRPQPDCQKDKICLSFYLSENNLGLSPYFLKENDIYFIYWLACLAPIYDKKNIYQKIIAANFWIHRRLPNWEPMILSRRRTVKTSDNKVLDDMVELFLGGLEVNMKNWQGKLMPPMMRSIMNKEGDTRVVADVNVIKLHVNDRREGYKFRLEHKLHELSMPDSEVEPCGN